MRRIFICLILMFSLLPYIKGEDNKDRTVTIHGITYALNDDGTATSLGSPTSETGYHICIQPNPKYVATYEYYPPTTHEFKNYLDSCGGVFTFPDTIIADGKKFVLTTIGKKDNPELHSKNVYAWDYGGITELEVVLPKTVVQINSGAFESNTIKGITLSNNVKKIGTFSFETPNLQYLSILESESEPEYGVICLPESLKEIETRAFSDCKKIHTIKCNEALEKINSAAFFGTGITSFDFPPKITTIETATFRYCDSLEHVTLNNVTNISSYAFSDCKKLSRIDLTNVNRIDSFAFEFCSGLKEIDIRKIDTIHAKTFIDCSSLEKVYMPKVSYIDDNAFSGCLKLKDINFENVVYIAKESFKGCTNITEINLINANYIGESAFYNCAKANIFNLNHVRKIPRRAFKKCKNLKDVDLQNIDYVGYEAFEETGITEIYIPSSTRFGGAVFYSTNMSDVLFEEGRETIPKSLLSGTNLKNIAIPEGVTFIDTYALAACTNMNIISLPSTLKTIGCGILGPLVLKTDNKDNIKRYSFSVNKLVVLAETPPNFNDNSYLRYYNPLGIQLETNIYVPDASVWTYQNYPGWRNYTNILPMSELTGINSVAVDDAAEQRTDDGIYYDLQGRKVMNPQKGVYIHQGKKVMIK